MPSWWRDDDELLAELGEAVRAGREVPDRFVQAGKAAFVWRTLDAELATLDQDSASDPRQLAGMRGEPPSGGAGPRTLSFVAGELAVDLEVVPDAIRGQLVPPAAGTVRLRDAAGALGSFPIDEVGWFVLRPVPTGRIRLHIQTEAGAAVFTDWFTP